MRYHESWVWFSIWLWSNVTMSGGCDSVPRTEFHGWQVHFGKPKPGSDAILSSPMHIYESYCQWQCLLMIGNVKSKLLSIMSTSIISFHHSSSSFTASFDEFVCFVCAGLSWDLHGTGNQRRNAWKVWNFWKCLESSESSKFRNDETFLFKHPKARCQSVSINVPSVYLRALSYPLSW